MTKNVSGKIPWRRKCQPTPVLLPGESHGWRSLVGYSPRGRKESDMTERLHFASLQECECKDFPGGPVAKTQCSTTGGVGSIPDQGITLQQKLI